VINGAIQQKDNTITSLRLVIHVQNLDDALEKALAEGGRIFISKKQIPGMFYSVIIDTEGNEINMVEKIKL
jgi:Predicted enzyme related to lactoylglutathione lyase